MSVNIIIFNCNGFKSFAPYIDRLLSKCDILCLQLLMLTKQECMLLNSCHSEYYGYGVSPVDATLGVIPGRPYGGVGFLWKKCFDASVSVMRGITNVDTRPVALPLLWLSGSAISPARLFK